MCPPWVLPHQTELRPFGQSHSPRQKAAARFEQAWKRPQAFGRAGRRAFHRTWAAEGAAAAHEPAPAPQNAAVEGALIPCRPLNADFVHEN